MKILAPRVLGAEVIDIFIKYRTNHNTNYNFILLPTVYTHSYGWISMGHSRLEEINFVVRKYFR